MNQINLSSGEKAMIKIVRDSSSTKTANKQAGTSNSGRQRPIDHLHQRWVFRFRQLADPTATGVEAMVDDDNGKGRQWQKEVTNRSDNQFFNGGGNDILSPANQKHHDRPVVDIWRPQDPSIRAIVENRTDPPIQQSKSKNHGKVDLEGSK
ncbi:hypothetical protein ACLOJK_006460 [Asimina triloba]